MDAISLTASKPPAPGTPADYTRRIEKTDATAKGFESMFMAQMMQFIWPEGEADENFGGGRAEGMWKGMFIQEVGTIAGKEGSLGVAEQVKKELLKIQEQQGLLPASAPVPHKAFDMKEMTQ